MPQRNVYCEDLNFKIKIVWTLKKKEIRFKIKQEQLDKSKLNAFKILKDLII